MSAEKDRGDSGTMKHLVRKLFRSARRTWAPVALFSPVDAAFQVMALYHHRPCVRTARLTLPGWNRFLYTYFGSFIRKNEERKLTGTAPYILGIGLSLYAYSTPVASAAICFSRLWLL